MLLLVGLLSTALAALVELPAALLRYPLADVCGTRCRLAGSEGTLWQGSSDLYFRDSVAEPWQIAERLSWRFDPAALLRGRLALALDQGSSAGGVAAVRMEVGLNGVELAIRKFSLPAGLVLSSLGRGVPTSGWGGRLSAEGSRMNADFSGGWHGDGVLRWSAARTSLLENIVLGDYRLAWARAPKDALRGELSSEQASLQITGNIAVAGDGSLRFTGTAEAEKAQRARLEKYLRAVGTPMPDAPGKYRLNLPNAQRF